jgi:hypothetical protein
VAALRYRPAVLAGKKVVLILDQFEQWLHAKKDRPNTELVQALRQCDGGGVQCVVMVRDDFWMAATRFMRELEIPLVEGQNSAAVELFDGDHARNVLAAFGRAFGKLPENRGDFTKEQKEFLKQAVNGLAQNGKVVSVRLALFAEMMKGKAWTPTSLKEDGGTAGVGVTFLEETFSASHAPPQHRLHQRAAQAVLKVLLPEAGADIKGHMRSETELREASAYGNRPRDFEELVALLDADLRLITPTDPEGMDPDVAARVSTPAGQRYFQLTHEYLVHSLRDWLNRKQKETWRGRAELRLADRAAQWNVKRESRHLPAWWEWLPIQALTRRRDWSPPQRKMMRVARWYHLVRGAILATLVLVGLLVGLEVRREVVEQHRAAHAVGLVKQLLKADIKNVPGIVREIEAYRPFADPLLRQEYAEAAPDSPQRLRASLALLPVVRSAARFNAVPGSRNLYFGFRPARTLLPH